MKGLQPKEEWDELNELGPNYGKGADFKEWGVPPRGQGKRTDLDAVVDAIKDGQSEFDIATNFGKVYTKYYRGIGALISTLRFSQPRQDFTYGYWVDGPTGTGKSRCAFGMPGPIYSKASDQWFDLYQQEPTVVIDEYRSSQKITFSSLLTLVDSNPLIVPKKGSSVHFNSSRVVVTAPLSIEETFSHIDFLKEGDINQLKRRFLEIAFLPNRTWEENSEEAHRQIQEREEKGQRDVPVAAKIAPVFNFLN